MQQQTGTQSESIAQTAENGSAKACILKEAERLFAENGFAGTSMAYIARASGTSKPLIHHHFKSKRELYLAVRKRVIERLPAYEVSPEMLLEAIQPGDTPTSAFLRAGLLTLHDFLQNNPAFVRLTAWARLEGETDELPAMQQVLEMVIARIKDAQACGMIRDDLDAGSMMVAMGGALYFFLEHENEYLPLMGTAKSSGNDRAKEPAMQYINQLVQLFGEGMTPAT